MTRPQQARFLRTEATMAYPRGRLLAMRDGWFHVLALDGWTLLRSGRPPGADWVSRGEAEAWCVRHGCDRGELDRVPSLA